MIGRLFSRRTLEHSFAVSMAFLVVVLLGATLVVVRSQVQASLKRGLEARGASIARSIGAVATPSLLAYNYAALQIAAEGASADDAVVYVVIHDKEGGVAGVAGRVPRPPDYLAATLRGLKRSVSADVRVNDREGRTVQALEVAVPVRVEGVDDSWGTVRVGLSYAPVHAELRELVFHLLFLGVALALAAVACGRWIALRITAPLRQLAQGTEALSAGEMSHRVPVKGAKELADLVRAYNVMMDRVQEKAEESAQFRTALEALNASLEWQVHERTRALKESEAQYKTLVEHSPDSILIVQGGRVRFVNRAFIETFGITEEQALTPEFDLGRIFDPTSAALARGSLEAWERGEPSKPAEVLGRDASGNFHHLELRGSRIEYRGAPAAECLLVDTTEAKRLQERLTETEKLRALGELAGGVAHDFNNLLGAIIGRVQLLRRRGFNREIDLEMAVVEKAAQDGRETIRRIQDFSRTRRDKKFSVIDLGELLRDAAEITRTRWKDEAVSRNVRIDLKVDAPTPAFVLANASELREVFTNLVLNAVDAMPQGGRLDLICRQEGERVFAEVSDTGVGMTETIRRQLFDPFFTTKGSRGMGLGMSVAYGIVTRHEGKIEVRTALGKGTRFVLEFRAAERSAISVAGGDGAAMPQLLRPGRILVIDDEPEVAAVVRDVLVAEGHAVDVAASGTEGVRLASIADFDMVFTDLGMPDISGWQVADQIAQVKPGLPVALVSGWGSSLDEDEAKRRGIVAIVHKPFDIAELVRAATEILSEAMAERSDAGVPK